jgi:multiple antibiotic resistance protein
MGWNWTAYLTFFITMVAIINPIGDLAIFIGFMAGYSQKEQRQTALHAGIAVFVILLLSIWIGTWFLDFFGITSASFETAGGFVLLLLGISMVNGNDTDTGQSGMAYSKEEDKEAKKKASKKKESVAIVPMAIPIAVGPGAIAACIIHAHAFHGVMHKLALSGVCFLLASVSFIFFYFASFFTKVLGVSGVKVTTRIMGMVLMAIAFGMMAQGAGKMLPGLV